MRDPRHPVVHGSTGAMPLAADLARLIVRLLARLDMAESAAYGLPQNSVERNEASRVLLRYQTERLTR